jgi:hypothetical protein
MWSHLAGFAGGVAACITTEFVAKPLARFIQLRSDAAVALALYEEKFEILMFIRLTRIDFGNAVNHATLHDHL